MNPTVYLQILPSQLLVQIKDDVWSAPVTRGENGKLAPAARERITADLRAFLLRHGIKPNCQATVALTARGVTLRTLEIPRTPRSELEQVLQFQIENEFPVPPDELAWGWQAIESGNPQTQKVLVVAVRRELIREWQEILTAAGLAAAWTLAAFARAQLIPPAIINYAQLHVDEGFSDLVVAEAGSPVMLRSLPWGAGQLEAAVQARFNIPHSEAVQWLAQWRDGSLAGAETKIQFEELLRNEAQKLAGLISSALRGKSIFLSGTISGLPGFVEMLRRGAETNVEILAGETRDGRSSATWRGLDAAYSGKNKSGILTLGTAAPIEEGRGKNVQVSQWKWPAYAAALIILAFFMRYAEALVHKPRLAKRIDEIKRLQKNLPSVENEINFLHFVQTNQTHYLDAIHALASAAAPGTKVDGLTMNRRGDLSVKATMQNAQQATDLRTKLYDSGLFSAAVLEEQNPSPDGQKMVIRMGAQLKAPDEIKGVLEAAASKTASPASTNHAAVKVVKK